MEKVTVVAKVTAPAEDVWRLIGGWNALPEWHPAVETSALESGGQLRRLTLIDGSEFTERLENLCDTTRSYTYSIVSSPLPCAEYCSTISVISEGERSTVEWSSSFAPLNTAGAELSKTLEEFYREGFENLKKMLGG